MSLPISVCLFLYVSVHCIAICTFCAKTTKHINSEYKSLCPKEPDTQVPSADHFQDSSSGIQVSTWCGFTIPAVVLWVDVNVHWPLSPVFCTDETAGRSQNEDKIWRPKRCRPRTSYLEQSTCWAASSRHFTGCIQKQTGNLSVRQRVTDSAHLQGSLRGHSRSSIAFHSCVMTFHCVGRLHNSLLTRKPS